MSSSVSGRAGHARASHARIGSARIDEYCRVTDRLGERHGRLYFALQSVAGLAWWVAVFTVPAVRDATLGRIDPVVMAALDIPLFVVASALAAFGLRWAAWVATAWTALIAVGIVAYATITGLAGWGAVLMIAAAAGSIAAAMLVLLGRLPAEWIIRGPFAFRLARPGSTGDHVKRTGAQLVLFWGLFLVVFPFVIVLLERRWQLDVPVPIAVPIAGVVLLLAASALGIWSAVTMSTLGEGTPLPSATARRLVIAGPYRFVRNPMAVAGIVQGAAVGFVAGSWLVVVYAVAGSFVWNELVRPIEEAELESRFGVEYAAYRDRVACWVPRIRH
ncbi:protein-S-isoprenylcysteine O-methyltransferase Ste14 [Labedella gwakjiensis]|uniref:Isoprenylcysteine carboxylmethyltransferase family protein n=1 Tax=Labedella gwakjiensis TaxID=390269 RepID=A0A2P8GV85_9MICO|nr:isoprenylcysteine carboxylmethyltransferase family protein [Labedella gwakjiensis]PSL37866.1 protein-S-isoprenylcysteine O-methyltransferase Ste14 [Labedella gwakjiensis]RUQ87563.1 isoprenylcysteine carboxylmethyltransferase family protein [Labedella gwakjiensis]